MSEPIQQSGAEQTGGFNKVQSILWPIHGHELKKFLPISLLMFCIVFVYAMISNIKDVFVQKYAVCGGTELIPVLKLWFVMPFALLTVILFTWLINKFGSTKTFYIMTTIFLVFFAVFVLFLFPNAHLLHVSATKIRAMQRTWPRFLFYVIPCLTNWCYTLFYMFAEVWGVLSLYSLFWQFAGRVTKKSEARRFYGLYTIIASLGVILSGGILRKMSRVSGTAFDLNVKILIGISVFFGLAAMVIFYGINKFVLKGQNFYTPNDKTNSKKRETTVLNGLKILFTSPYFGLIAILILGYGIAINFIEVMWKEQMRATLTNANEYSNMMGNFSVIAGILTILITILSTNILRRFKWKIGALITPTIMLIVGVILFTVIIYGKNGGNNLFGVRIPIFTIWIGLFANALAWAVRYCLFDSTRMITYRPLDQDAKTKGQAAVEVIGSCASNAGTSGITHVFTNVVLFGSKLTAHIYTIVPIFIIAIAAWIAAVFGLGKKYENKVTEAENNNLD